MTISVKTDGSPLLQIFTKRSPAEILNIAAKINIASGFVACQSNTVTSARWNKDKSALVVTFNGNVETILIIDVLRIVTKCNCKDWQPARNCPHVVVAWATIKRLVSPETLKYIKFNKQMLNDMKSYLDMPGGCEESLDIVKNSRDNAQEKNKDEVKRSNFRLVIEKNPYGATLVGNIKRGDTTINSWTSQGIPVELAHFLSTYPYFEATRHSFELYTQLTDQKYPIFYKSEDGSEIKLTYCGNKPCSAGISLDIIGNEIRISRTFADGTSLKPESFVSRQLMYDMKECEIRPVQDSSAWNQWDIIHEKLMSHKYDLLNEELYDYDDLDDPDPLSHLIRSDGNAVTVPLVFFNQAAVRLSPQFLCDSDNFIYFIHKGKTVKKLDFFKQKYMLDIPDGLAGETASMMVLGEYGGEYYGISEDGFWIFDQYMRSQLLPNSMQTKKRLKPIIEALFMLLDESRTTARTAIMRSVTSSRGFAKHNIKSRAKDLMHELDATWKRKYCILMATPAGWNFLHESLREQAGILKILYEMFGLEAFDSGETLGKLTVNRAKLQKILPDLIDRLHLDGYSLNLGAAPVTKAAFEFSLDASRSTLDWFELKPEIRCNGELLSEKELQALMDDGMLHRNGKLMLMDDLSAQIFAMFNDAMPSSKKKKKGEQEPVRVPRLQILDWLNLRSHGVQVKISEEDSQIMESLLNFSSIPKPPIPAAINANLRNYQMDAWHWLAFLYEHRFGACLADDMGLGKTLQGITLLAGIISGELASAAEPGTPHLVVAPPSLLFNWEAEIARFLPGTRVLLYTGTGRNSAEFVNYDVIITSYGIVHRDCNLLSEHRFNVLIFDETQMVKNLQAATSNAVRKLKGAFTLALTGTPVENHLGEYYAIMDLCLPGLLGTREEFSRKFSQDGSMGSKRLIARTRPFVLRRTKQLIASELPPKIEMDIPLELNPKQRLFYQRTVEEVKGQVKDAYESHATAQARIIALTAILRLRQICLAPALASSASNDTNSPKLEFLIEQLRELRDEGQSALIFSQFTGYLDIIEKGLEKEGFNCLRLDGSTPVAKRKNLVQSFQNSQEPMVFLISLKAGGKGLNLTRASYVYHMDPWWNPAVENQASDRAHRIGQTEQVTITRLIMRHTVEEKMMALKEQKSELYKAILEEGTSGGGAGLTREDFEFLLG